MSFYTDLRLSMMSYSSPTIALSSLLSKSDFDST